MGWLEGSSIETFTGRRFSFVNPESDQVCIEDIAHGLSNTCRFGGQCSSFYSVAEHSVLVSRILQWWGKKEGLMHDAHEAYLGDIPQPLKGVLNGTLGELSRNIDSVLVDKFDLDMFILHGTAVKRADKLALVWEAKELMCSGGPGLSSDQVRPSGVRIPRVKDPKELFMVEATKLGIGND